LWGLRTRSAAATAGLSRREADTGPLDSTQVSLLPPPRCIDSTREFVERQAQAMQARDD
jgi:hypothetical protein